MTFSPPWGRASSLLVAAVVVLGIVDQRRDDAAEDRAGPVDPVHVPVAADERRAEGARRVHAGAGDGTGGEDAEGDGETDGDSASGDVTIDVLLDKEPVTLRGQWTATRTR